WRRLAHALLAEGLLETSTETGSYPTVRLTPLAWEVMRGQRRVEVSRPRTPPRQSRADAYATPLDADARDLFERLRILRRDLANEAQKPAFMIFADASLRAMAARRPVTETQFRAISGVGARKAEELAGPFTRLIEAFCDERGLEPWPEGEGGAPASVPTTRRSLEERRRSREERRRERDANTTPIPTALQSLALYREGLSIEEIAAQRGLTLATIATHLAAAINAGEEVDASRLIPPERLRQIAAEFERLGDLSMPLKPVKDALGDDVSYEQLHLARAILRGPGRANG
ncbi:MAG TPA: helix-turn-helix domain-containing protein, partial [Ktedonobacterales bacterium]